jgi:hypothetical protein
VQQFRLVEFVEPDGQFRLTASGVRTIGVLSKHRIAREAKRSLNGT